MILNSIDLENIRSYQSQHIEFPRGITLFEGDIGSGKSTILMGIEFALFGLGSIRAESLLSKKAEGGSVTLRFEVDGTSYDIRRALKQGSKNAQQDPKGARLMIDGVEHPFSPSELKQKILHVLKFNEPESPRAISRIYRYAVFTPQSEMNAILHDKKLRLETIRRAFHIEDYKMAHDNAEALAGELKKSMNICIGRFEDLNSDESELKDIRNGIEMAKTKLEEYGVTERTHAAKEMQEKTEIEKLEGKMQEKIRLEEALLGIADKITSKEDVVHGCKKTIERNEKELSSIKIRLEKTDSNVRPTAKSHTQIQKDIVRLVGIRDRITSARADIQQLTDMTGRAEKMLRVWKDKDVSHLQKKLSQVRLDGKKLRAEAERMSESIQVRNESVIRLQAQVEKLEEGIKNVKGLGTICGYCGHELSASHIKKQESERTTALKDTKKKLQKESAELGKMSHNVEDIESKISNADSEVNELEGIMPILTEYSKGTVRLEKLLLGIKTLEGGYHTPEEKSFPNGGAYEDPISYLTALKEALLKYEGATELKKNLEERAGGARSAIKESQVQSKQATADIDRLHQERADAKEQLAALKGIQLDRNRIEKDLEQTRESLRLIRDEISTSKESLKALNEQANRLDADIKTAQEWKDRHDRLDDCREWLDRFFIPTVSQIEKQVMLAIQQTFGEIYQRWYTILIDDTTKETHMDEEFTPITRQDGFDQEFEYLSGGEKTSISLAYRLTLNSMMRRETDSLRSNLLILDEPTEGFSKTQLSKMRDILDELKSEQIILVSHEKELEGHVDNIFHVTKNVGVSSVSKILG